MNTGRITVFDFDNRINCRYMFDPANLWTHGVGWFQFEEADNQAKQIEKPGKCVTFCAEFAKAERGNQ